MVSVTINDCGQFRNLTVHLGRLTVLVGANNSGKTTFLRDLACGAASFPKAIAMTVRPRFDVNVLWGERYGTTTGRMDENGAGMQQALCMLAAGRPEEFAKLEAQVRRIVPAVEQLLPDKPDSFTKSVYFSMAGGLVTSPVFLGDGVLTATGLLTLIYTTPWPEREPSLLLLDDLERHLHPASQEQLVDVLREVQADRPNLQIVATTNSPALLRGLEPQEVLVLCRRADGTTACAPLTKHPQFSYWDKLPSENFPRKMGWRPPDMWRLFGERWVTDVPPTAAALREAEISDALREAEIPPPWRPDQTH